MDSAAVDRFNLLISEEHFDAVLDLFDQEPSVVRRLLTRITYTQDTTLHTHAIKAFYILSKKRSEEYPQFFDEIIRRHIWGMNDEGGNVDWSAPEIIGATIAGNPDRYRHFIPIMYHAAIVEQTFHKSLHSALGLIASVDPEAVAIYLPEEFQDHTSHSCDSLQSDC